MPFKCCVTACKGNYDTGPKVSLFRFPREEDLKRQWIRAIPRENMEVTKHSRSQYISSNGYPLEEYTVETEDGYLLSVQRIPHGKNESKTAEQRPVVLLVHGAVGDTIVFVWNHPNQSLGFVLADKGYDVWMGNMRGNTYSRRNVKLSPDQNEFWDFSLDTKAFYDLPPLIDFVLRKTGRKSLTFVGYSEGNTVAFALLSKSPEYNKKINLFAAYAPVVFTTHVRGLLGLLVDAFVFIQPFYRITGFVEFFPHFIEELKLIELFSKFVCGSPLRFICAGIYYGIFGYDSPQLNHTRLPVYFNQYPAGESTKAIIQYSQLKYAKKFQMYDYYYRNIEYYNQSSPPEYDLSKITAPVALYSGMNDIVGDPRDVDKLRGKLKSVVEDYVVPNPLSNHGDYIFGINAYSLIHDKLLSTLEKYSRN